MNPEDLEAFAQFLQMNGMTGQPGMQAGKKTPSVWQSFQFKACLSVGMFASAILGFNQLGHLLE